MPTAYVTTRVRVKNVVKARRNATRHARQSSLAVYTVKIFVYPSRIFCDEFTTYVFFLLCMNVCVQVYVYVCFKGNY